MSATPPKSLKKLTQDLDHSKKKQKYYSEQKKYYNSKVLKMPNQTPSQLQTKPLTLKQRSYLALAQHYTEAEARRVAKTAVIDTQIRNLMSTK